MGTLQDEVAVFTEAARWATGLVVQVGDDQWEKPGLGEWDVRALVGHTSRALLTVEQYLQSPADTVAVESAEAYYRAVTELPGADPSAVLQRGVDAGTALGPDPSSAFRSIAERVTALLDGQNDQVITTIVGGIGLSDYLPTRTFELVVHGLDIARATGLPQDPPAAALQRCLELAGAVAAQGDSGATVLLALTGRQALPDDYSIL